MNPTQLAAWKRLTKWHPTPWYLEQSNDSGVEVKDNRGETVFFDDFGTIPDEAPSSLREQIIGGGRALASWLVAFSEEPKATQPEWLSQALNEGDGTYKP